MRTIYGRHDACGHYIGRLSNLKVCFANSIESYFRQLEELAPDRLKHTIAAAVDFLQVSKHSELRRTNILKKHFGGTGMVVFGLESRRSGFSSVSKFGRRKARARSALFSIIYALLLILAPGMARSWALGSSNQPPNSAELTEQVVREALSNQFCEANLKVLAAGSALQSASAKEASDETFKCFNDPDLLKSVNYMERERRTIVKLCANADVDASARALALYHLGALFRHAQDFYRGSNYVDLQVGELTGGGKEVTPEMLYGMELVDWTSLLGILRNGDRTKLKVEDASRADPNSPEAKRLVGGVSYFSITRELSVRETQRQWKLLESLVRSQFKANAAALLLSLQKSGVPKDVFDDVMKHGDAASF